MSFSWILQAACFAFLATSSGAMRLQNRLQVAKVSSNSSTFWTQCTWQGPEKSGYLLKFPMEVPGSGSCEYACKRKLWDLNSVMAGYFRSDDRAKKCRCFLNSEKKAIFRFDEDAEEWFYRFPMKYGKCSAAECWARYQSIINYKKQKKDTVSVHNMPNMQVSCIPCETKQQCPVVIKLPTYLNAKTVRQANDVAETLKTNDTVKKTKSQADLEKFIEHIGVEFPTVKPEKIIMPKPAGKDIADDEEAGELLEQDPQSSGELLVEDPKSSGGKVNEIIPEISGGKVDQIIPEDKVVKDDALVVEVAEETTTTTTTTTVTTTTTKKDEPVVVVQPVAPTRPCGENQLPADCIIVPGPGGYEWQEQIKNKPHCKGNLLVVKMRNSMATFSRMGMHEEGTYLALQFDDTHDITDFARTIPSGLSISVEGTVQKKIAVQHRRLPIDITLFSKAGGGFMDLVDAVKAESFANTQKLVIRPTYGSQARWEHSQPPSLGRSLAQGVLSIGAWFGAKSILPTTWVESVEYLPVTKGSFEFVSEDSAVACIHKSASHVAEIDDIDKEPDEDDASSSDDDDDWSRDTLDEDEEGEPDTSAMDEDTAENNSDLGEDISNSQENTSSKEDADWEYEPYYEGFNGDSDGGYGLYGN